MNNAPFHIGQRVVCVSSSKGGNIVKGRTYTVAGNIFCNKCNLWFTFVNEVAGVAGTFNCICGIYIHNNIPHQACLSTRFAPVSTRSVEIDETIKEQAEEMIRVKETIKELNPSLC